MEQPQFLKEGFKEALIEFLSHYFIFDSTDSKSKQEFEDDMIEIFKSGYHNRYKKDTELNELTKKYEEFIVSIHKQCKEFINNGKII